MNLQGNGHTIQWACQQSKGQHHSNSFPNGTEALSLLPLCYISDASHTCSRLDVQVRCLLRIYDAQDLHRACSDTHEEVLMGSHAQECSTDAEG